MKKEKLINQLYKAIDSDIESGECKLPFRFAKYDSLRADENVARAVIWREPYNMNFVDDALRSDPSMADWVVENVPEAFYSIIDKRPGDQGHKLKSNMTKEQIFRALDGMYENYGYLPKVWKSDLDVIRYALYLHPKFILKATPTWTREDFDLVLLVAENSHPCWVYPVLKKNWNTAQASRLVVANPLVYEFLNSKNKNSLEVIKAAFSRSPLRRFSLSTRVMDTFDLLSRKNQRNDEISNLASVEARLEEAEIESGLWPHEAPLLAWEKGLGMPSAEADRRRSEWDPFTC